MILCIPVTPDGLTAPGWGRTHRVAVATASGSDVSEWQEFDVDWDTLHDEGNTTSTLLLLSTWARA